MITTLIIWLLSLMAGSGVYGMIGDDPTYQANGTGTFGFDNETLRFFWGALTVVLTRYLPVIAAELAKKMFSNSPYWPVIQKLLEALKLITPDNEPQPVEASGNAGGAKSAANTLADYFADCNCKDGVEKATGILEHVYELEMKEAK